jgi:hypothetical protein
MPDTWPPLPSTHPDNLAECVLGSWEPASGSDETYLSRHATGTDGATASDLLALFDGVDLDDGPADDPGLGRARAVRATARFLLDWDVHTAADFRARGADPHLHRGWSTAISQYFAEGDRAWHRAHLLAETDNPIPSRAVSVLALRLAGRNPKTTTWTKTDVSALFAATADHLDVPTAHLRDALDRNARR